MQDGRTGISQYALLTVKQQAVFPSLPYFVATALVVTLYSTPATIFIDDKSVVPEISETDIMVVEALPASISFPYQTNAVLMRKRGHSNTLSRSNKKRRLTIATATATAAVKEKKGFGCHQRCGGISSIA